MSDDNRQILHQAYELIKAGNKPEAVRLLVQLLKADRNNADAWWLLANATPEPDKKRQALEQVLRLNPGHGAAQSALAKLSSAPPPAPRPEFTFPDADATLPPSATPSRPAPLDDPFASAPRFSSVVDDDPFAEPARPSPPPPRRAVSDDPFDDPFSDPFASAPRGPAPRPMAAESDPFADPFASSTPYSDAALRREIAPPPPPRKKGMNPVVACLVIFGIIALVGCAVIVLAGAGLINTVVNDPTVQAALGEFQTAVNDPAMQATLQAMPGAFGTLMADPTLQAAPGAFATMMADPTLQAAGSILGAAVSDPTVQAAIAASSGNPNGIVGRIIEKGNIAPGQTISGMMEADGFTHHAYKFTGTAGQTITIDVNAVGDAWDTKVTLLNSDEQLIAENDDISFGDDNLNSRLTTTLPNNGTYTIIVGDAQFGGGNYEVRLQ